jgi:micrococcal nuclease
LRRRLIPVALATITLTACASHQVQLGVQAPATLGQEPAGYEVATVTRVVDGDTIEARIEERVDGPAGGEADLGQTYDIRLIGIDTPESVKPGTPVECFAKEASAAAEALLEGESVRLVKDVEETDRYQRLLRYVYIGEEMANARLVVNGYANAYTYPPNVRHADLFVQLEREAREGDRGLWAPETCSGAP